MSDEKDRFGDKLRAAERARENLYFARIDEEILARMRAEQTRTDGESPAGSGTCPRCDQPLRSGQWRGLEIEFCPDCGGLWLDTGDLLTLADRQDVDLRLSERKGGE